MKFFTKEWFNGELSDEVVEQSQKEYWDYIDAIYTKLPFILKMLAKQIHLHDAILDKITVNKSAGTLILQGLCGDLEMGYFYLTLTYFKVMFDEHQLKLLNNQKVEIRSDEIEILKNGLFNHRLLVVSGSELDISFQDVKIAMESALDISRSKRCKIEAL